MKKILILHTSVGLGHKVIAENIGYHLTGAGFDVRLGDVLDLQKGKLVSISTAIHYLINTKLPFIWRWFYTNTWFTKLFLPFRLLVASRQSEKVLQAIKEFEPDLVITTQTSASAIVSYLKKSRQFAGYFAIAFSDYHLHHFWLYDNTDFYLANTPEQKTEMEKMGIPPDKIFVCGMTLKPAPQFKLHEVRSQLGVGSQECVVLIASGSLGIGLGVQEILELVDQLQSKARAAGVPARCVVVCGRNHKLRGALEGALRGGKTIILGHYQPLTNLYALASVFITKPGGLTVAEALQMLLPLVVTHILPGQEELNYHYLAKRKLIIPALITEKRDIASAAQITIEEIVGGGWRKSLAVNSYRAQLACPGSEGLRVVEAVRKVFHNGLTKG